MNKNGFFFSLRWKISFLVGVVFLLLHSTFSYLFYMESTDDFSRSRDNIQTRHINVARALTKDSFLVLDQVAELFSIIDVDKQNDNIAAIQMLTTLDNHWSQWQFIWGLESAVFYDQSGKLIRHWGEGVHLEPTTVMRVLHTELPGHKIICPNVCYQLAIIPVMANSRLIGAFGVSRSFADTVIEFNQATGADIGVLVSSNLKSDSKWPYKISALTNAKKNSSILDAFSKDLEFSEFLGQRKVIEYQQKTFEVRAVSVDVDNEKHPPFFLIMDDISFDLNLVQHNLRTVWLYGVISLVCSLVLLILVLSFSLRRIISIADAFPLLAKQQYQQFRSVLESNSKASLAKDELDVLTNTAFLLTDQLEGLESEIRKNICKLVEQGNELTAEKDFVHQLIDVSPIMVITQNMHGVILSINQAGIHQFSMDEGLINGSVFDNYIPQTEQEHLTKLYMLREGRSDSSVQIDGVLHIQNSHQQHVSWIHSVVKSSDVQHPPIILTLGVDISERKQIENKMLRLATYDQLTGLTNRRFFQTECEREIATAKRYGTELALFYLDLDQFKVVNDTCGHEAGDKLLRLVASTLEDGTRETDVLSRIGGDEFTLIIPNAEIRGIDNVAKKINQSLAKLEFWVEDKLYKINTSIGVAVYPQHGSDVHELLSNADLAMYRAKESGRGQYHIFSLDQNYQSRLSERLYWKEVIEDALINDRIELYYQPILDVKKNCVSYYECLSRIKSDNRLLMPDEYIVHAEELGLIGQIDRVVLKKVLEQHISFKHHGKDITLSLNLSGRSFNDTTIFDDITHLLSLPEVDPKQIIFEITETATVSNFSAAQALIKKIKTLGCSLALDDFGVGFSSFYYLKHLPVDYVKIDGSFIRQIDKSEEDKIFVKALMDVSKALGKKTVAEFVENAEILEILRELGVDYAQGYHIGKPGSINTSL